VRAGRFSVCLLPFLALGCVQGPNYERPQVVQPDSFRSQISASDAASFADQPWWQVFGDPALQGLIKQALTNNYDLQVAAARIEQARALTGVVRSQASPQVSYNGFAGGEQTVTQQPHDIGTTTFASGIGSINAVWELDVWGRIKRQTEAAEANMFAQEEIRRGLMLSLVSDVAAGYFRLLELDRQLAVARESQSTFGETHRLFGLRFEAGKDSRLPVERSKAALDQSNASVADLTREVAQQENAISILTGG
jgi:multidrug efflux system outer membrane protein